MSVAPIVVGTDGSETAHRAVEHAGALACALDAPLHIVMSCSDHAQAAWMAAVGGFAVTGFDPAGQEQAAAAQIVSREQQGCSDFGIDIRTHVCTGDPAEALLAIAEGEHAQMIVVGNRGMTGHRRVLGSVPNRVSHRAKCAVLIVPTREKPD
jgi:nucleotide-binding universal stress UspA family protein